MREPGIRLVAQLGHLVDHREEVAWVGEIVVRIDVRHAAVVPVGERRQRRHLRDQANHLDVAQPLILDRMRLGVKRRQRADRRQQHPHRMRVVPEAVHELLDVLVHERVVGDQVRPLLQLLPLRELAVDQQVRNLEVGRALGQLLDRIASVLEDPPIAVDIRHRRPARRRRHVRRVQVISPKSSSWVLMLRSSVARIVPSSIGTSYRLPVRLSVTVNVSVGMAVAVASACGFSLTVVMALSSRVLTQRALAQATSA